MRRLLFLLPLALLLTGCKEKRYFTEVTGDVYLAHIVFDDESSRDFTVVCDVIYAGEDVPSFKGVRYVHFFHAGECFKPKEAPFVLDVTPREP